MDFYRRLELKELPALEEAVAMATVLQIQRWK
jgi:hypothetical protein